MRSLPTIFFLFFVSAASATEQWGIYEAQFTGPSGGNPFSDVQLTASFTSGNQSVSVNGFYDGDGIYRLRFSPPTHGEWSYKTQSNIPELSGKIGQLSCTAPSAGNHGPVRVAHTYHFAYADGTPFFPIGTTIYGWLQQPEALQDQTIETLRNSPFDKVRMMLLPSLPDAPLYPYLADHTQFDVRFFQHLERRVGQLSDINVQAELILMNPYKKGNMPWIDDASDEQIDGLLRYTAARLSAYRNIWWSLANEYGQVKHKTDADWDHFFQTVRNADPYGRLRSIHNAAKYYDNNKPWVTHASIQNGAAVAEFGRAVLYRELIPKPLIYDEVCYEGNLNVRWGNLSGQEEVKRFWLATIAGAYVTHGETITGPNNHTWISDGGVLSGQSPARLAFLRKTLEAGFPAGVEPIDEFYHDHIGGEAGKTYLVYFGEEKPATWKFELPRDPPHKTALAKGMTFRVDILDTWNMTETPVPGVFTLADLATSVYPDEKGASVTLPGHPYVALRIQRIESGPR